VFIGYRDGRTAASVTASISKRLSRTTAIGCIVWANGLGRLVIPIVNALLPYSVPIAIVDEVNDLQLPEPLRTNPSVRVVSFAAYKAGLLIGRHLLPDIEGSPSCPTLISILGHACACKA